MASSIREAELALHRAKRLVHDINVDIMYEVKTTGKRSNGNDIDHSNAIALVTRRESELGLAIIKEDIHNSITIGAL